jgi:hypothetical protein
MLRVTEQQAKAVQDAAANLRPFAERNKFLILRRAQNIVLQAPPETLSISVDFLPIQPLFNKAVLYNKQSERLEITYSLCDACFE